jgi:uncharacterized membrane protein YeaQ/YmgE (transglycosylase-associated protein family)
MTVLALLLARVQHPVTQRDVVVYVKTHSILWWLLIGLIAGWLAGTVARGRGFGCVVDVIGVFGFWGSLAAATVGAIVLVAIARLFAGGRGE